jgi:hypothetical protein
MPALNAAASPLLLLPRGPLPLLLRWPLLLLLLLMALPLALARAWASIALIQCCKTQEHDKRYVVRSR